MLFNKNDLELAGAFRRLLKNRFLVRSRNEKWFQTVVDLRKELQRSLEPMGIFLEINESLGVAYLKPLDDEFEQAIGYELGRKLSLSPLASALLLKLRHSRHQFYFNPSNETVPLATTEELREFLQNFNTSKIDSQFERSFRKALEELQHLQVLIELRADSGTFEISPLCDLLLPLDKINEIRARMEQYFAHFNSDNTQESVNA